MVILSHETETSCVSMSGANSASPVRPRQGNDERATSASIQLHLLSRLQSASAAIPSVRNADTGSLTATFLRACRKRRSCWLRYCQTRTTPDRYPLAQPL